jgi:hypothetical protein
MRLFDIMRPADQVKKQKESMKLKEEHKGENSKDGDALTSQPVNILMKEFVEALTCLFCGSNNPPASANNSNTDNTGNINELSYSKERRSGIFKRSTFLNIPQ